MRSEQLEYLAAVVRLGSMRQAALELHVSQPAMSETLSNLERELGVVLLQRKRSGVALSDQGRELLPYVTEVLESIDRLQRAANQQRHSGRTIRVGTVNAATVTVLAPAIQTFRYRHPETQVSVLPWQQSEIQRGLAEGTLDVGLVNLLDGDDLAPDLEATLLLRGKVAVCLYPEHPLVSREVVKRDDLVGETLILMRAGYVMHRFVHRLFKGQIPENSFTMDGAEMGKLMVAERLGITLLPDYSIAEDPLERHGAITARALDYDHNGVSLYLLRRRSAHVPTSHAELVSAIAARSHQYQGELAPA